jgi:hypothetical protein
MAGVFICYRHDDTGELSKRLYYDLRGYFGEGNVFQDHSDLAAALAKAKLAYAPKIELTAMIEEEIAKSDVMLVIIGPRWLKVTGASGARRIDEPDDVLRHEIEMARRYGVQIIPVLVEHAPMPRQVELPVSIAFLSTQGDAASLDADSTYAGDVQRLKQMILALAPQLSPNLERKKVNLNIAATQVSSLPPPPAALILSEEPPVAAPPSRNVIVFVSYSRKDTAVVSRLVQDLQTVGIAAWIDSGHLTPGTPDWEREIRQAITGANGVVYVASEDAATSQYVRDELAIARDNNIPVYPVWVRGDKWSSCIPLGWGHTQFVDGRDGKYDGAVRAITATLTKANA